MTTKTTMARLVRDAKTMNPRMSDEEARELAQRVAASLAARRAERRDASWDGCR